MKYVMLTLLALLPLSLSAAQERWIGEGAVMAGMSSFRAMWDDPIVITPDAPMTDEGPPGGQGYAPVAIWSSARRRGGEIPGAPVFDGVHRRLLVKFPEATAELAKKINDGWQVERLELVLPLNAVEFWPEGYAVPAGLSFLDDQWVKNDPRWHAIGWALRRPWDADREHGPTLNSAINGLDYWARFGAEDTEKDRFPGHFGPAEVSTTHPVGRMDLTPLLSDPSYGSTLTDRLNVLANQGLLIRKWETYDMALWRGGYEWTTATGHRGIIIKEPYLEAVLSKGGRITGRVDVQALEWSLDSAINHYKSNGIRGEVTAYMADEAEFNELLKRYGNNQPDWMPNWQWQRLQELYDIDYETDFPEDYGDYLEWLDEMLSIPPRRWDGFQGPRYAQMYFQFYDAIPEPVKQHWREYWRAWLIPHVKTESMGRDFVSGQSSRDYYAKTGDWRGNTSVYRIYVRAQGTTNFNAWATSGTLLGGAILGDDYLIQEGRNGLLSYMHRMWTWADGSGQEVIDHYYYAHTVYANKTFADFGPDERDRLTGEMILARNMSDLISTYHPALRRFIATSGRTGLVYLFASQDGLNYIMHTLSPQGALTDMGRQKLVGSMTPFLIDTPAARIAELSRVSPWAPEWMIPMVDEKPLPFYYINRYTQWGSFREAPLWRVGYLGQHYGLASQDIPANETVPLMAQWRRKPSTVERMEDLGTLFVRFGANETEFLDTLYHGSMESNPNGIIGNEGGRTYNVQHKNTVIALSSPVPSLSGSGRSMPHEITSLQTSIGLFNFEDNPNWSIFLLRKAEPKAVATTAQRTWTDGFGRKMEAAAERIERGQVHFIRDTGQRFTFSFTELSPADQRYLREWHELSQKSGQRIPQRLNLNALPIKLNFDDRLVIRDGVTYVGIIPIPSTDLGRDEEMILAEGKTFRDLQGGGYAKPTLVLDAYYYRSETPLDVKKINREEVGNAYGGFIIEVSDSTEYARFEDFMTRIAGAELAVNRKDLKSPVNIQFKSGDDTMAVAFNPGETSRNPNRIFPTRTVNGLWPYLAPNLDRDSTYSQMGRAPVLEKKGRRLHTTDGHMAYLEVVEEGEVTAAYNPMPGPTPMRLEFPDGSSIQGDGRMVMSRLVYHGDENRLEIRYPDFASHEEGMARALQLRNFKAQPTATLNGKPVEVRPVAAAGAYLINLFP